MNKFITILMAIAISSCGAIKKTEEKISEKKTEKTSEKTNDSVVLKEINKAIDDLVKIKVPKSETKDKSFDSLVNAKVDEILEKINFKKTSGVNEYQISYNKLKREIEASMKIGQTENNSSNIKKTENTETTDSEYISTYIKKVRGIPFYWFIIAFLILFRKQIFLVLCFFFPVLKTFGFLTSLFGTKNNILEERILEQNKLITELLTQITQQNPK